MPTTTVTRHARRHSASEHCNQRSRRHRRPLFELLEDRRLLTTCQPVGDLKVCGDDLSNGPVYVGFGTDPEDRLLEIEGQVMIKEDEFTINVAQGEKEMSLSLPMLPPGTPPFWNSDSTETITLSSDDLTGGYAFQSEQLEGKTFSVLSVAFDTNWVQLVAANAMDPASVKLQGELDFATVGIGLTAAVKVGDGQGNDSFYQVFAQDGTKDDKPARLTGAELRVEDSFTVSGLKVDGELGFGIENDSGNNVWEIEGKVTIDTGGLEAKNPDEKTSELALTIADGKIESFTIGLSGSFNVLTANVEAKDLTLEFRGNDQYVIHGELDVTVPNGRASDEEKSGQSGTTTFAAKFNDGDPDDEDNPVGLLIENGSVKQANISVVGKINVLGVAFESPKSDPATFKYDAASDYYELSGTVAAPDFWNATVTMGEDGQKGIVIQNGNWSVDALTVSLSDIQLGAFEVKKLAVHFAQDNQDVDLDVDLAVSFPKGWVVEGELATSFNKDKKVFEIKDVFLKASHLEIPIPDTGLFVTEIDASLQNITQPSKLIVSGDITVEFGEDAKIFNEDARFFLAKGGFTVDKDHLELDARSGSAPSPPVGRSRDC